MSYLDEVISRTRSVAEELGKKSAEAIEVSKKKIELIDTKNKLSKAYAVLGKIQYELIYGKEPTTEEVERSVAEIEKYDSRVKMLESEINQFASMRECPACGADNKYSNAYCSQCGANMDAN